MASTKLGTLLKQARTDAGLTQAALAKKAGGGLTAAQISKAERGEDTLTQDQLKRIAKATGVTQASLLEASRAPTQTVLGAALSSTRTAAAKTAPAKSTANAAPAKSTAKKTSAAKTAAPKTPANADSTMKVTAAERKLVELYRAATGNQKKAAVKVLRGEADSLVDDILGSGGMAGQIGGALEDLLGNLIGGR